MNKYEDYARKALEDRALREQQKKAEANDRQEALTRDRNAKQTFLDQKVHPIVREAQKGLAAAGLQCQIVDAKIYSDPQIKLEVGHNRAGITLHRQSTITIMLQGNHILAVVSPNRGEEMTYRSDKNCPAIAVDEAIERAVKIWTEQALD